MALASPFTDRIELWLAELEIRQIVGATKDSYRDDIRIRLRVRPWFEHYTLGEVATGRVEAFLKGEAAVNRPGFGGGSQTSGG